MKALCVDDEVLLLTALENAVKKSPDISETAAFDKCSKALTWALNNKPDIAFLDIRMRGMDGFEFAEKLLEKYPELPIVFCTGYSDYAVDAFKMHAYGYVMKPIKAEDIQREIDNVKERLGLIKATKDGKLKVQCFGNFEAFANGQPLQFKRKRSKELLAFLIDRKGARVSAKAICTALWEDEGDIQKNVMHLYKLVADLKSTLSDVGLENVFIKGTQDYSVNTEKIECDYYDYIADDSQSNAFIGEYMSQYSWAEETLAMLENGNF